MATAHATTRQRTNRPSSKKKAIATEVLPDGMMHDDSIKKTSDLDEETRAKYQQLEVAYARELEKIRLVLTSIRSRETNSPGLSDDQVRRLSSVEDASTDFSMEASNLAWFFQNKYERVLGAVKLVRGEEKKELQGQAERYSALTHLWILYYEGSWGVASQCFSEACKVEADLPSDAVEFLSYKPEKSDEGKRLKKLLPPPSFESLVTLAEKGFARDGEMD